MTSDGEELDLLWSVKTDQAPVPKKLYHYCNPHDQPTIMEERFLRAYPFHHYHGPQAADRFEWRLGWQLVLASLTCLSDGSKGDPKSTQETDIAVARARIASHRANDQGPFGNPFQGTAGVYEARIACLTDQGPGTETARQIERCGKTSHVALGGKEQDRLLNGVQSGFHVRPLRVMYSSEALIDAVEELVNEAARLAIKRMQAYPNMNLQAACNAPSWSLRTNLVWLAAAFKRQRFEWESEWRLLCTVPIPEEDPGDAKPKADPANPGEEFWNVRF